MTLRVMALSLVSLIAQQGLDLPVAPVKLGDPAPVVHAPPRLPEPDLDEDDDPRDTPLPTFYGEEIDAETDSIIYVLDISCSMGDHYRLDRARNEVIRSFSALPESWKFNLIAYSAPVYWLWRSTKAATPENKARASAWLLNWNAHSCTGTGPAVAKALQDRDNYSVVVLTDGHPNYGVPLPPKPGGHNNTQQQVLGAELHRKVIRDANLQGARIDMFGLDTFGGTRAFCQGVAEDNGGKYFDVH